MYYRLSLSADSWPSSRWDRRSWSRATSGTLTGISLPDIPSSISMSITSVTPRLRRLTATLALLSAACAAPGESVPTLAPAERAAIADSIGRLVREAYDLSRGEVPTRMLSVYPAAGRVVSATAGRVSTSRDSLAMAVNAFWDGVGQYMVRPAWTWDEIGVDVLGRDAAVMTARYTVPHWTDQGTPHVIGGVWSAVWRRQDGRWVITHEHLSDMPRTAAEAIEATMPTIPATASDSGSAPAADSAHKH